MMKIRSLRNSCAGFSLVELLIAMTIGLLLLTGLSLIFVNTSKSSRDLQILSQQIENGRYASDILTQDLHHAGFYGRLYALPAAPGSADPCLIDTSAAGIAALNSALAWPVQGYRAADLATIADVSTTTCISKGLLTAANLKPGSDVLVIRRAHTTNLNPPAVAPSLVPPAPTPSVTNDIYIQATGVTSVVARGTGAALAPGLLDKVGNPAPLHKYIVHVYFVAPCSVGSGTNGVCTSSDDTIPTLKRLELGVQGGATTMTIVPLVEGIEYLKVEYGVDNLPPTVSTVTRLNGDGTVDSYTATPGNWTEVIAANIYLLARNTEFTTGYVDNKSYVLGAVTVAPADYAGKEAYRRHTYTVATRLTNVAGRKEIP